MKSGCIARFEYERAAKMNSFRMKGINKWQDSIIYLAKKGRISEIVQEEMQSEYNNNALLVHAPQFRNKICKSAKEIEKEGNVQMFPNKTIEISNLTDK